MSYITDEWFKNSNNKNAKNSEINLNNFHDKMCTHKALITYTLKKHTIILFLTKLKYSLKVIIRFPSIATVPIFLVPSLLIVYFFTFLHKNEVEKC